MIPKATGSLPITIQIPVQRLRDILTTAVEGGIGYWAADQEDFNGYEAARDAEGYVSRIVLFPKDSKNVKHTVIDEARLAAAIGLAFKPDHTDGLTNENAAHAAAAELCQGDYDQITADVLVQLAAFEEVVYG